MDNDDGARITADPMFNVVGVDTEGDRINVGKEHAGPQGEHRQGGRPIGEAGADDLVADADATAV